MPRYLTHPAAKYRLTWTHHRELPLVSRSESEPYTFGHLIAVLSAGIVLGLMAWVFVVGLFAVAA